MELSENYRIVYDSRNVILQFHEMREKTAEIKKRVGGKDGPYEVVEETYYPNLKQALQAFLHKSTKGSESIEECIQRIEEAEKKIEEFIEKIKQ